MPTPVYELQMFFKNPMEKLRYTKSKTVLWTIGPLCLLMMMTGRMNAVGMLLFTGFLFLLPALMGLPGLDFSETGLVYTSLRGRCRVGWDSIGAFEDYDSANSDRIKASITGPNAKSFPLGFAKIGGQKTLIVDLPSGLHGEAVKRLNEFRAMILAGVPDDGQRSDAA